MRKVIFCVALLLCSSVFADDFNSFKQQTDSSFKASKGEWNSYKSEIQNGFNTYKNIMNAEFVQYKTNIAKNWKEIKVSQPKMWVEYVNNYKIRKTVDFENKTITIEVLGDNGRPDFTPIMKDLLNENTDTAFHRNPVVVNTEQKIKTAIPGVQTDQLSDVPFIQNLFSSEKMTDDQISALAKNLVNSGTTSSQAGGASGETVYSVTVKLPDDIYKKGAQDVTPYVQSYAQKYQLNPALVMAVIYTESRFNPMATSYVPAYGLMQIVPSSAGMDATAFLEGQERILAPSYLYDAENNVKIGTAYFYLLYNKYFKGVTDSKSRLFCAIAAYNTGAGNVAYAFNINNPAAASMYDVNSALPMINSMSSDEVYNYLRTNLKYAEARQYIVRVYGKIQDYSE